MSLKPQSARMDYGEQLMPPPDYELDRAVGTTFSLDLEALMVLPVALFHSQTLDGNPEELRFELLDAITQAAKKIHVFCQKGHVKVPRKYHHLMAYWEAGVHEVLPKTHVESFHPKVWVIRYLCPDRAPYYRVLVMSRNLTQSRDWDIAISLEGVVGEKAMEENQPLVDFLQYLRTFDQAAIEENFLRDLGRVAFDRPGQFDKLTFIPSGIPGRDGTRHVNPIGKKKWEKLLVISPFLDVSTLDTLRGNTEKEGTLLSRKEELDALPIGTLARWNCWQFSETVLNGERQEKLSEPGAEARLQNLHAKIFIGNRDGRTDWYLGSANCSAPAQDRNTEFMVHLRGRDAAGIRIKDVMESLTLNDKKEEPGLFERYRLEARPKDQLTKNLDQSIRKIRYDLSSIPLSGFAERMTGGTAFALTLEIDAQTLSLEEGFQVRIRPVGETAKNTLPISPGNRNLITDFKGYEETSLSCYLEFQIWHKGEACVCFLIAMDIRLPESRLGNILLSIINSRDKFLKYLAFLLTGEDAGTVNDGSDKGIGHETSGGAAIATDIGVYERLLVAASRSPRRLDSIERLIYQLQSEEEKEGSTAPRESVISGDFRELWEVYRTYLIEEGRLAGKS